MNKHFRIIELASDLPDVLIFRDRDENSIEIVKIHAFGKQSDIDDIVVSERIEFENPEQAISFIRDFSVASAEEFFYRNYLKY